VLISEPGRELEAATRLGRIGFDMVAGYLEGGMALLADRTDLVERVERLTAGSLAERLTAPAPPTLIDVRTPSEFAGGCIDGAMNLPLSRFADRMHELADKEGLVVYCTTGYRSAIAGSLLRRDGRDVSDLVGGYAAWQASVS
jgi:hydroxyacylglutathione hydrolase